MCALSPFLFNIVQEILASRTKTGKGNKTDTHKEEIRCSLFTDNIAYEENPDESTKKKKKKKKPARTNN